MKINKYLTALFAFSLLCTLLLWGSDNTPRIVVVGDVHGDLEGFVSILRKASIVDSQGKWAGGTSILVQDGDFLDRGPRSREVMELLMQLGKQAGGTGGRVVTILGNHEMMNMIGDLRYVPAEEYAHYSDRGSQKRRDRAYKDFQKFWKHRARVLERNEPIFTKEIKEKWEADHPLGFIEHREAFSPEGRYGKWLRSLPAVVELDGIIFVHGGISSWVQKMSISEINEKVRQEIRLLDESAKYMTKEKIILPFFTLPEMLEMARQELELRKLEGKEGEDVHPLEDFLGLDNWITVNENGPLWFRGFSKWTDEEIAIHLPPILSAFGNRHFVVGHTAQDNGAIRARNGGQIFLIDSGMLGGSYYPEGRASALEIKDGMFTAIYPAERVVLLSPE